MASLSNRVRLIPAAELDVMVRDAGKVIEDLRQAYVEISSGNIDTLQALINASLPHDETWWTDIYRLAHDLKGQGTTFGHDLVTKVAHNLCILIKEDGGVGAPTFTKRATAHCEALHAILDKDLRGTGGEHGSALLNILSIAV